jgi:hypothetical protein
MAYSPWEWITSNSSALTFIATLLTGTALAVFAWLTYSLSNQLTTKARQPRIVAASDKFYDEAKGLCYERITINNNGGPLQVIGGELHKFLKLSVTRLGDRELMDITEYWFPIFGYFEKIQPTGNYQHLLFTPVIAKVSTAWLESIEDNFMNSVYKENERYIIYIDPRTFLEIDYLPEDANTAFSYGCRYYTACMGHNSSSVTAKYYYDISRMAAQNIHIAITKGYEFTTDNFDGPKLWSLCKNHFLEGTKIPFP